MCNKCCDMGGYAPKIIDKSIGDLPATPQIMGNKTSYVLKSPTHLTGTLPTPWTLTAPDSPTGRLPAHTVLEETISPYTRDRTAKTPMSMEEFLELQEAANRIDDLYLNNPIEYAKTILGEKRVEELLKEQVNKNKSIFQKFLAWLK